MRHKNIFKTKKVLFSGNIQDNFFEFLKTLYTTVHFHKYNSYLEFPEIRKKKFSIYYSLYVSKKMIINCDTIIYYWPKNKSEAYFQIINILSVCSLNTSIFIVGNNLSGVKSAFTMFYSFIELKKIDNAKHSILIFGKTLKKIFFLKNFFKTHSFKNYLIKSLPGVFGHKKIDEGSKLLVSTFNERIKGSVLDVGCGTGFLGVSLLLCSNQVRVTLVDNHLAALTSSYQTLKCNNLKANIIFSDLYSNIHNKFDLIVSNPPFHNDLKLDYEITEKIIKQSINFLKIKGELRFVTNIFLKYDTILNNFFKTHHVLKKTQKFKIYQAFLN